MEKKRSKSQEKCDAQGLVHKKSTADQKQKQFMTRKVQRTKKVTIHEQEKYSVQKRNNS